MNEDLELQMLLKKRSEANTSSDALDTLLADTIVEPTRRGPLRLTVDVPLASPSQKQVDARPPARWKTTEFVVYGVVLALVCLVGTWKPIELSSSSSYPFRRNGA